MGGGADERAGRGTWQTWNCTVSCMAPRCTGMWGALETSPPSGPKRAQEKSRRSLMLVEMAVRCRMRPICSGATSAGAAGPAHPQLRPGGRGSGRTHVPEPGPKGGRGPPGRHVSPSPTAAWSPSKNLGSHSSPCPTRHPKSLGPLAWPCSDRLTAQSPFPAHNQRRCGREARSARGRRVQGGGAPPEPGPHGSPCHSHDPASAPSPAPLSAPPLPGWQTPHRTPREEGWEDRGTAHSPAMLMKRCEKMDRWMGSSWAPTVPGVSAPTEMRMSPVSVTSAWQPGSTRMVLGAGAQGGWRGQARPHSQPGTSLPQAGVPPNGALESFRFLQPRAREPPARPPQLWPRPAPPGPGLAGPQPTCCCR